MPRAVLPLALLGAVAPLLAGAGGAGSIPAAVGIVTGLEGKATLRPAPGAAPEPLTLLRRIPPGARLTVAPRSTVIVVLFDGQRYALDGEARALVEAAGLRAEAGRARRLAPVPAVVDLAPILRDGAARSQAGAVRIRGETSAAAILAGLHPRDGAAVPRDGAILSFSPSPEVTSYRVTVEAEDGKAVFTSEVRASPVRVPAEALRPATVYAWRVEPSAPPRPEMRAEAVFVTLGEEAERARESLAAATARAGEPDLALLLAEVDRCLGLRPQAVAEQRP